MQISNNNLQYKISYKANIKSPKLKFRQADFFVNIRGYGKNNEWAESVKTIADTATNLIRNKTSAENTLKIIAINIAKANQHLKDQVKSMHTGILRIRREGWERPSIEWEGFALCTDYSKINRYKIYKDRLDKTLEKPLSNPFKDIELTRPQIIDKEHFIQHGDSKTLLNALKHITQSYKDFISKYNYKTVNKKQLKEINHNIAQIRWLLAHATPWERGSDAISNVLMRAMYKSLGIKSYPLKKGISLDMEAYCTNLKDYKKNFATYFEKAPEIIE